MNRFEATQQRHSVRAYQDKPLAKEAVNTLKERISAINKATGLHIQLVTGEPKAFQSRLAKYGSFSNVTSYLVMAGLPSDCLEEQIGYYGEELVIMAQQMGVNSCWVGLTYKLIPEYVSLAPGEKVVCVIALGYGASEGRQHKNKTMQQVSNIGADSPAWFAFAVQTALNAPTAVNQQKFHFELQKDGVTVKASTRFSLAGYTKVDLGIVKYHFELGVEEVERTSGTRIGMKWMPTEK